MAQKSTGGYKRGEETDLCVLFSCQTSAWCCDNEVLLRVVRRVPWEVLQYARSVVAGLVATAKRI